METLKKTSAKPAAGVVPTEKAETKNLRMVNTKGIEEAKIVVDTKETIKPVLNLDETIEVIQRLHKANLQRNKLTVYSDMLANFDIEQKDEDLKETAYYTGCKMMLSDGKRNEFELRNPTLIREVVEFLKERFISKLSEVEASIVLPY